MRLTIHTFGIARDICGGSVIAVDLPDETTVADLQQHLTAQFPRLGQLASFLLAVNAEYAPQDMPLHSSDEIAIIPPVSGG